MAALPLRFFQRLTFKLKLRVAFGIILLLMGIVALIGYLSYRKRDELGNIFGQLDQVSIKALQMIEYEQDFLLYDAVNQKFFETGKSEYLTLHNQLSGKIDTDLKELGLKTNSLSYGIKSDLDTIARHLKMQSADFQEVVTLVQKRGYRDFGAEGRMRENVHELEKSDFIPEAKLLSLRRHEKDYIIRKDEIYVRKLKGEVTALLASFPEDHPARPLLNGYLAYFKDLVQLETQIGVDINSGFRKKIRDESTFVRRQIFSIYAKSDEQYIILARQLWISYISTIALAILTVLVLAYVLGQQILRPVQILSTQISQIVEQGFKSEKIPEPLPVETQDEIGTLTRNFNLMTGQIFKDAALMKKQNLEMQASNLKLTASENRLRNLNAVKDKFFSIISHDMKGPMSSLNGFLEMLHDYTDSFSKEEIKEFASSMNLTVKRIVSTFDNLLQWSRSQTGGISAKPERLALTSVIENNVGLLRPVAFDKGISLTAEVDAQVEVVADKNMLDFVLRNLISNAVKFTNTGGTIRVSTSSGRNMAYITIKDDGVGMSEGDLLKLFQPDVHFTTSGTGKETGTGFGLLLCKDFIEKNGGEITVKSALNEGTIVSFTLPTVKETVREVAGEKMMKN
jgi:signal transduction histidine kinase